MPRKTPVRELQADEESQPVSPLRRSTRLASPGPSKLSLRRNSASEETPAKLPKAKRLSLSTRRESEDTISKTEEAFDISKKSSRITRSSSKSPSSLPSETETKPKTRARTGSISKITEEEISSENEKDMSHKSLKNGKPKVSKDTPSKPRTRRSSITDKIVSLEAIEESPKMEHQSKSTHTKKESLKSITEVEDNNEEAGNISSQTKNIKTDLENEEIKKNTNEIIVKVNLSTEKEKNVSADTKSQSSNIKEHLQEMATNDIKESTSSDTYMQEEDETHSCKISPVVILNSIEKQMNYSKEKMSPKKTEIFPIKDDANLIKNRSPVVVLQSIEKIISKQKNEEFIDSNKIIEADENKKKEEKMSVKNKEEERISEEQSLDQILTDKSAEINKNENEEEINAKENLKGKERDHIREDQILTNKNTDTNKNENEEDITSAREKLNNTEKDNIHENQSSDLKVLPDEACKMNESENDSVKLKEVNQLEKQEEINEVITMNGNQYSEESTKANIKELPSSLLTNPSSIIEGSDGSFSMSLSGVQNISQEDITSQNSVIVQQVGDNSNSIENSNKENSNFNDKIDSPSRKDKSLTSEMECDVANASEGGVIGPKQNFTAGNESVLASNVSKSITLQTEQTEQSSFYEPMEIEYTDFNCTINSSVVESKDKETSSLRETSANEVDAKLKTHENEGNTTKTNIDAISKQNELKIRESNVTDQNKLKADSIATKQISDKVVANVDSKEELLKSDSVGNQDIFQESEICDKSMESVNKTADNSLEHEHNINEKTKQLNQSNVDMISVTAQKSVSFAFNLDEEQFLSDEDVNNKSIKEKNDVKESSLDVSKLESGVTSTNARNEIHDIIEENECLTENKEIQSGAKSPSPVFSIDENQCLSDDETEIDSKIKEQNSKKQNENDGINKQEKSNEEKSKEPELQQSPSSVLRDDSQSADKVDSFLNENEKNEIQTKELDANVESNEEHGMEYNSEKVEVSADDGAKLNGSEADKITAHLVINTDDRQSSSNEPVTEDQQENTKTVKPVNPADDETLLKNDPKYWKSKTKKLSKERRKSNIEDTITSTVRALIENVDDLDAKVDALIEKEKESNNLCEGESDDEISQNSFIDDMAEEGEEDTPSEGSNDVPVEGEEDFLEESKPKFKKDQEKLVTKRIRKLRIISDSDSNDDQSQVKLSEKKESLQLKSALCDSDDKMSTDPYLGLTPPSHVSVQESSSDIDIRSVNNENEIIINDDDNLKSLEAMRDETIPNSKQVDVTKASSIICLDSDEDAVFQKMSEPNDLSRAEKLPNEQKAINVAGADQKLAKSPKSMSSLNIQENIKLEDVKDGILTNKICGIVDFFYSNIKHNNSISGTVSLNVSLDFADVCEETSETQITAENSNIEHIKTKSSKKRLSESSESFSEKENEKSKKMKFTSSPQSSISNEDDTSAPGLSAPTKKIKQKKSHVSDFDVEFLDMSNISTSMKSKTIKQKKLLKEKSNEKENAEEDPINVSIKEDSSAIKTKHTKEILTHEKKKNKIEGRKSKKMEKDSSSIDADKENDETISQKDMNRKKLKRKKAKSNKIFSEEQVENEDIVEHVSEDETVSVNDTKGKFSEAGEYDVPQKKDKKKKKKKKSKHLLKVNDENAISNENENNENHDRINMKKKLKLMKSNKQEIETEAVTENIVPDESDTNDKTHKKKKLKLIKPGETKIQEVLLTNTIPDNNTEQKKKKRSKCVFDNESNPTVDDEAQTKRKIKSTAPELSELTSNEQNKKPKRKRKFEETDEDILSDKLKTVVSSKAPSISEDQTVTTHKRQKQQKKRYGTGSFDPSINEMGKTVSYFPSHMSEKLSTKTAASTEEFPKTKKTDEKRLKKKQNWTTFSKSSPADSNSWITTPLETAIVPSKKNSLYSDPSTSKSTKKPKLEEVSEPFSCKDFKNKMLYDFSRVKRMPSKDLLKNQMKRKLFNPHY